MKRSWGSRAMGAPLARALVVGPALALTLGFAPPAAAAGPHDRDDAASAYYVRGAKAYDRAEYATAAVELARADEIVANDVTLELALSAVVHTDDAALGMTLAERADARVASKALDAASHAARRKFASKVGKVSVTCPPPEPCSAMLDGAPLATGSAQFVAIGSHRVALARASRSEDLTITVEAGKTVQLAPTVGPATSTSTPTSTPTSTSTPTGTARPTAPRPPREPEGGLSPGWFWLGAGLTGVLGGVSIASGLDTAAKHDAFLRDRSNVNAADAGLAADRRTVVLIAATGAVAAVTLVVGVFFVRWRSGAETTASVGPAGGVLRTTF